MKTASLRKLSPTISRCPLSSDLGRTLFYTFFFQVKLSNRTIFLLSMCLLLEKHHRKQAFFLDAQERLLAVPCSAILPGRRRRSPARPKGHSASGRRLYRGRPLRLPSCSSSVLNRKYRTFFFNCHLSMASLPLSCVTENS